MKGSEFWLEADSVVVAIGQSPNPVIQQTTPGLDTNKWGGIVIDEATAATSLDGVYAGGDVVRGGATVLLAMKDGKAAAKAIHEKLSTGSAK
jgi:glutamate synthase (NADPH/NADH) small chain